MLLALLLLVPLSAGLLCLGTRSRVWWERVNLLAFAIVAVLAILLGLNVAALGEHGAVTALDGFLRADALSALVIGLTAFVGLVWIAATVVPAGLALMNFPLIRSNNGTALRLLRLVKIRPSSPMMPSLPVPPEIQPFPQPPIRSSLPGPPAI